jgi:hypothetical protein
MYQTYSHIMRRSVPVEAIERNSLTGAVTVLQARYDLAVKRERTGSLQRKEAIVQGDAYCVLFHRAGMCMRVFLSRPAIWCERLVRCV